MRTKEQNKIFLEKRKNRLAQVKEELSLFNALINREIGTLQLEKGKNLQISVHALYTRKISTIYSSIERTEKYLQQQ